MKSIIKSIAKLYENGKYIVSIQTKSNKYIEYKFDTQRKAAGYYNSIINE